MAEDNLRKLISPQQTSENILIKSEVKIAPKPHIPVIEDFDKIISISNQSLRKTLLQAGIDKKHIPIIEKKFKAWGVLVAKANDKLFVQYHKEDSDLKIVKAQYYMPSTFFIEITFDQKGLPVVEKKNSKRSYKRILGKIQDNFYYSSSNQGLPRPIATECIKGFQHCVNFRSDMKKGASYDVLYSVIKLPNGQTLFPNLKYAAMQLKGKRNEIYYYKNRFGESEFLNSKGESLKKASFGLPTSRKFPITSGYGTRVDPFTRRLAPHLAIDYGAPHGATVIASASGVISFAGTMGGYGHLIEIDHGFGYKTRYAHLSRFNVSKGARVTQGQAIGCVGSTGRSTSPHLHFEMRYQDRPLNPKKLIHLPGSKLSGSDRENFLKFKREIQEHLKRNEYIEAV